MMKFEMKISRFLRVVDQFVSTILVSSHDLAYFCFVAIDWWGFG